MTYISWNASHELGHGQIDQEHLAVHVHINRLFDVVFGDWSEVSGLTGVFSRRSAIEAAVEGLRTATAAHFRAEEMLMMASDFPGRNAHIEQHTELLAQLDDFAEHFHASRADSLPHTVRFLREWFEFHIDTYDRSLVHWLNTGENLQPELTAY